MGTGDDQTLPNQPITNVSSPCDCKRHCNRELDCEYWVYANDTDDCWLKRKFIQAAVSSTYTSGWKKGISFYSILNLLLY